MKFTNEDLMKAMGLKVGDRVKFKEGIFPIIRKDGYICYQEGKYFRFIAGLVDEEIEILPAPKRVGDLKCEGKCISCPCIYVCNEEVNTTDKTLYEVLELGITTFVKTPKKMNGAIYDVIKSQLDKEVKEND